MNKYKLANNLYILFLGYGLDLNKTLKIQLKTFLTNEFFIENWDLLDILINDLITKYNPFFNYKLQWFINEAKNIIEKLGGTNGNHRFKQTNYRISKTK